MEYKYYINKRIRTLYKVLISPPKSPRTYRMYYADCDKDYKWRKYYYSNIEGFIRNNQEFKYSWDDFQELTLKEVNDLINKRRLIRKFRK